MRSAPTPWGNTMAVKSQAQTQAAEVKRVTSIYINGAWTPSSGKDVVEVVNPTTGRVIATVPAGTTEDVDRAVAAAKAAFVSWSASDLATRAKFLRAVGDGILARGEEIAAAAASDVGTPVTSGRYMHAKLPASTFANMADNIEKFEFETREGPLCSCASRSAWSAASRPGTTRCTRSPPRSRRRSRPAAPSCVKPSEVAPAVAWRPRRDRRCRRACPLASST